MSNGKRKGKGMSKGERRAALYHDEGEVFIRLVELHFNWCTESSQHGNYWSLCIMQKQEGIIK